MKNQKAIVITVIIFAALGLTFWLGYESGPKSTPASENKPPDTREAPLPPEVQPIVHIERTFQIPPRDPSAKSNLIDLTSWYNAGLTVDWHKTTPGNNLGTVPSGLQTFAETEFDVRGLIQVCGSNLGIVPYPRRVEGIRVGLRCSKLHFLHNALLGSRPPQRETIGTYIVHYADNESETIPLQMGENILDWWDSSTQLPPGGPTVLAWEGRNAHSKKLNKNIHVNKFTWNNQRADMEVATLDFVSAAKTPAPFLIAITAEP